jgi:hypothetical protein
LIRNALSIEEAVGLIADSKRFLEPYKAYGKMINDGITQLDNLERLVRAGSFSDALNMSSSMCDQITAYRGFVPKLAENLEKITEILKRLS